MGSRLILSIFILFQSSIAEIGNDVNKQERNTINRIKRQGGYGEWNNGDMGGWNGPQRPPDDSIKGSVGTQESSNKSENQNSGSGPWWPNENSSNMNYNNYNHGQFPMGNSFGNGPNTPYGQNNGNGNGEIKGSVGAPEEPTRKPYGYGNGFRSGYGNQHGFGFGNRAGYNERLPLIRTLDGSPIGRGMRQFPVYNQFSYHQ